MKAEMYQAVSSCAIKVVDDKGFVFWHFPNVKKGSEVMSSATSCIMTTIFSDNLSSLLLEVMQ